MVARLISRLHVLTLTFFLYWSLKRLHLGLFRSDYMIHEDPATHELGLKQVEFNTISSSFGPLACQASAMHR